MKTIEKKCAAQIDFINEKKNDEIRKLLLDKTLASSVSIAVADANKSDNSQNRTIIAKRGSKITKEILDSAESLEDFFVREEETNLDVQRIYRLAETGFQHVYIFLSARRISPSSCASLKVRAASCNAKASAICL